MEDEEFDYSESYQHNKHRRGHLIAFEKNKLKKLMHDCYNYPVCYSSGPYVHETGKGANIRYGSSKRKKFYKKCARKVIRNDKDDFSPKGKCWYKKKFDLKWNID